MPLFSVRWVWTQRCPLASVALLISLSVGDCWNRSPSPQPSDAAFVCYSSALAHGRVSGVSLGRLPDHLESCY